MNSNPNPRANANTNRPAVLSYLLVAAAALLVSASFSAAAQPAQPADPSAWQGAVGGGVVSSPAYPGSASAKTEFVPLLLLTKGALFIGGMPGTGVALGVGYTFYQTPQIRLGAAVGGGLSKLRKEADFARLSGLGDINNTVRGSIFGSYNTALFGLRGNIATDLGGNKLGTLVSVDADARGKLTDQLSVSAGPGLTWADGTYSQTVFGINAAQSAASQRPAYSAKSGVNSVRFTVGADYSIDTRWGVRAFVTTARLQGDAANSPITEKRSQNSAGAFVSYRF